MFLGVGRHCHWVVGDFVVGSTSCWHFQNVWTTKVGAFKDWLQFPVDDGLVGDGDALGFLAADRRHDAVDVLRPRQSRALAGQRHQQRIAAFHLARQVLQQTVAPPCDNVTSVSKT